MNAKPLYPVPPRTATIGMALFLLSLGLLFAAALLAYFLIRFLPDNSPPMRSLHLPMMLWISTAAMIAASITMNRALAAVRTEKLAAFRSNLLICLCLAIAFISIQTPALIRLMLEHQRLQASGTTLYGMLFFLILLHALHVIGGLAMLIVVIRGANLGRYDHEHHVAVRNAAWYWHFLDLVWLVMFVSLSLVG